MKNLNEKRLFKKVFVMSGIASIFALFVVGICIILTIRLLPFQWMIIGGIGAGVFVVSLGGYLVYCWRSITELNKFEDERVKLLNAVLMLPVKLSVAAFFFWIGGSLFLAVIFYFFFHFSITQAFFTFLVGIIGGIFGPLIVYYLYKITFAKEFSEVFEELDDYSIYEYAERFPLGVKKIFPVSLAFALVFILLSLIFIRLKDETVFGTLISVGRIEMQSSNAVVGTPFTVESKRGDIGKMVYRLSEEGKDFYIEPRTGNVLVFKKEGEKIKGLVYPAQEFVKMASPEAWLLWIALFVPIGVFGVVIYLSYKDDRESFNKLVSLLQSDERVFPTDDEWNSVFFSIINEKNKKREVIEQTMKKEEEVKRRLKYLQSSIHHIAENISRLEEPRKKLGKSLGELRRNVVSLRGLIEDNGERKETEGDVSSLMEIDRMVGELLEEFDRSIGQIEELIKESKLYFDVISKFREAHEVSRSCRAEASAEKMDAMIQGISEGKNALVDISNKVEEVKDYTRLTEAQFNEFLEIIKDVKGRVKKVSEIVNVIKDILEETNILSLNAAIIAAQSGEKGKSFAVVADEIKELADRTAMSTGEIKKIVEGLNENVDIMESKIEDISKRIKYLGQELYGVLSSIGSISERMGEITEDCFALASIEDKISTKVKKIQDVMDEVPEELLNTVEVEEIERELDRVKESLSYFLISLKRIKEVAEDTIGKFDEVKKARVKTRELMVRMKGDIESIVSETDALSSIYEDVENLIREVYENLKITDEGVRE